MIWIYSIFVWIFMFLFFVTPEVIKLLFLGLEIGVLIGQVIFFINGIMKDKK